MKVSKEQLEKLVPLFEELAQTQAAFWDALYEIEKELGFDLNDDHDFTGIDDEKSIAAWLETVEEGDEEVKP